MQVAQALSNSEIAAALHLTEATVKTHVGRILAKLEHARPRAAGGVRLRHRAGAAVAAVTSHVRLLSDVGSANVTLATVSDRGCVASLKA